jgi:hypothetical protein
VHGADPAHALAVDEGLHVLAPELHVGVGRVGRGELRGVVAGADRTGQHQVPTGAVREAGRDVLALVRGDPPEHDQVAVLAGQRPAVGVDGQRGGQVHVPDAAGAQGRGRGGELVERDAVHPRRRVRLQPAVQLGVLAQVPVQRVQHRQAEGVERGQAEGLLVVVDEVDALRARATTRCRCAAATPITRL